jgi:hypothetical protein
MGLLAKILEGMEREEAHERRRWRAVRTVVQRLRVDAQNARRAASKLALTRCRRPESSASLSLAIARTKGRAEAFAKAAELMARELRR